MGDGDLTLGRRGAEGIEIGITRRPRGDEGIEHAAFGPGARDLLDVLALALAHDGDRVLDQVPHDLLDVPADVADLGELRGLDLGEGRADERRDATRDLRLAHTRRADEQDVLRQDLFAHLGVELHAAPAIADGHGHGALGVALSDDVAIESLDDRLGRQFGFGELHRPPFRRLPLRRYRAT